jgi:AcrR family transcriptional regulator
MSSKPRRKYQQRSRAEGAEQTRRRIVDAFLDCNRDQWFDEITLGEVARRAGVTTRTVIRQFGGKEGLVAGVAQYVAPATSERRAVSPGDVDAAIERLFENYEQDGRITIRALAQEERYPVLKPALEAGRAGHRAVAAANFAPWLDPLAEDQRQGALDALVIVTDIYAWKLLRVDMGRPEAEARRRMKSLVEAVLFQFPPIN